MSTRLRQQMQNDMVIRGMAARTQESYLSAVRGLAKYYRRPPDAVSVEEVQCAASLAGAGALGEHL